MPLIWSHLLLFMLILNVLLPYECNALKDVCTEPVVGSKRKFEHGPAAKIKHYFVPGRIAPQIVERIEHFSFSSLSLTDADVNAVDEVTNIFNHMPIEWQKNRENPLFYHAIIAKIVFNRFREIYYHYSNKEWSEMVYKILEIFNEVYNKDYLIDSVNCAILMVEDAIKFYAIKKDFPFVKSELNNILKREMFKEWKQMHTFHKWLLEEVLQKIVGPGIEEKQTNYEIGEQILESLVDEDYGTDLFTDNDRDNAEIEPHHFEVEGSSHYHHHHFGQLQQKKNYVVDDKWREIVEMTAAISLNDGRIRK